MFVCGISARYDRRRHAVLLTTTSRVYTVFRWICCSCSVWQCHPCLSVGCFFGVAEPFVVICGIPFVVPPESTQDFVV